MCWLCEKYFHCSDNSEIYTDTKLPPYLASWQVYRVKDWVRSACGQERMWAWHSWLVRLRPDTGRHSGRRGHNGPSDTRRCPVTRLRLTCHTQWQWSSGGSVIHHWYHWDKKIERVPGPSLPFTDWRKSLSIFFSQQYSTVRYKIHYPKNRNVFYNVRINFLISINFAIMI